MDVQGKVALVTGGARGLGKAYTEALLSRGATVIVADKLMQEGSATEKELQEEYGKDHVTFISVDLTQEDETERMFSRIDSTYGSLDILINNAGIAALNPIRTTFEINLFALVRCCDLAMTRMDKTKGGKGGVIVNISSMAGIITGPGCPTYHASKHAASGYTGAQGKILALGESGVRMVGLCPGFVKTALTQYFQDAEADGDQDVESILEFCGGWTEMAYVVKACMSLIEKDVPSGALVRVDNLKGIKMILPEEVPCVDLP